MSVERIYIGGLDPPRLTPGDIIDRIRSLPSIEIQSVVLNQDKPFVHLNATSKQGPGTSALAMIAKQYNNVKWKGCKLTVEAAKPDFLERLEEERRQRQQQQQQQEQHRQNQDLVLATELDGNDGSFKTRHNIESNLPRRLRIRKKYGDEAYHVDTKPIKVTEWSEFVRAVGKVRKRREKHFDKTANHASSSQATSFMNRSVHLYFEREHNKHDSIKLEGSESDDANDDDDDDDDHHHGKSDLYLVRKAKTEDTSDDFSVSKDDSDDSQSSLAEPEDTQHSRSEYIWSEDSDSEEDRDNQKMGEKLNYEEPITINKVERESVESDAEATAEFGLDTEKTGCYKWSSDEDTESKGSGAVRHQKIRPVTISDEFAAGVDLDDGMDLNDDEDDDDDKAKSLVVALHAERMLRTLCVFQCEHS